MHGWWIVKQETEKGSLWWIVSQEKMQNQKNMMYCWWYYDIRVFSNSNCIIVRVCLYRNIVSISTNWSRSVSKKKVRWILHIYSICFLKRYKNKPLLLRHSNTFPAHIGYRIDWLLLREQTHIFISTDICTNRRLCCKRNGADDNGTFT